MVLFKRKSDAILKNQVPGPRGTDRRGPTCLAPIHHTHHRTLRSSDRSTRLSRQETGLSGVYHTSKHHSDSHVTGMGLFGRRVLVVGHGPVGKGIAERVLDLGAIVLVSDLDPVCLLEAGHLGCETVSLDEGLARCQIIVTATGVEGILRKDTPLLVGAGKPAEARRRGRLAWR
jgi:lactate dehydrogenase-like 2-hydroxyacid dehydrogenase